MKTAPLCPRCGGFIPRNAKAGEYIGALSRIDNVTEICSPCGEEEALVALIPISEWPIGSPSDPLTQAAAGRFVEAMEMTMFGEVAPK